MEQIYNNLGEVCPVRMLHDLQLAHHFSLQEHGWRVKSISKEFGWSRNTIWGLVDRCLPVAQPAMVRPRKLAPEERYLHSKFNGGVRNADVLRQQMVAKDLEVTVLCHNCSSGSRARSGLRGHCSVGSQTYLRIVPVVP
jgi:hypothetical protein